MPAVEIRNVVKNYRLDKTEVSALRGVNLTIAEGDIVGLSGPSGSGKSTMLNLIGAIDVPSSGEVLIHGQDIAKMPDSKLSRFRNRSVGFIFQAFNLIPVLSVFENVEYPLVLQKVPPAERKKRVNDLLAEVGIAEYARRRPDELSGGQRQRVAIARALVTNPVLVVADEPTASLDHKTGTGIMELLMKLNRELKTTVLFATHDPLVTKYARTIVSIFDGLITEVRKQEGVQ
jgi:putative ABC transport system ATP-binding protein